MAVWGGSNHQKRAARAAAAKEKTSAQDGQKCPLGKCHLRVTIARADTGEGVAGISVEAKGPATATKASVKTTGLADFGEVQDGQYTLTVKLGDADKKKFVEPKAVQLTLAKGDDKAQRIELAPLVKFRVVLIDDKAKGIASADWELDSPSKKGKTGADGLIEADLPWDSDDGRALKVKFQKPPDPADPPAPVKPAAQTPPPYPAPLDVTQFADDAPAKLLAVTDVDWKITLADLPDGDTDEGVKARLANLGFDTADDEKSKRAVTAYQKVYLNKGSGSGRPKDILSDIKTRHDKSA